MSDATARPSFTENEAAEVAGGAGTNSRLERIARGLDLNTAHDGRNAAYQAAQTEGQLAIDRDNVLREGLSSDVDINLRKSTRASNYYKAIRGHFQSATSSNEHLAVLFNSLLGFVFEAAATAVVVPYRIKLWAENKHIKAQSAAIKQRILDSREQLEQRLLRIANTPPKKYMPE